MGIIGVQASGAVATSLDRVIFAGKQKMIMGIRVGVNEELLGIGPCLDEGFFHMDLILVLTRHWWECVPEGRDVVLNIVHISEVKSGDLFPQHGVGLDDIGGAVGLIHLRVIGAGGAGRYRWLGIRIVLDRIGST